jgi:predicted HicB family RNase H-like nuclease
MKVRVYPKAHKKLKVMAAKRGVSIAVIIESLLAKWCSLH